MFLTYGKVNLKIVKFLLCERTAEYDPSGIDYLYTRWKISVEAIYTRNTPLNVPYAISHRESDPANVPYGQNLNFPSADFSAPITDRSLIHALQVPRQRLTLSFGSAKDGTNEVWAVFPSNSTYPCDLINGPIPLEATVEEIRGEGGMFLVRFTVETASNDCQINGGTTQYILSNRWTSSITVDENYFETRTFKGQAIFRADLIHRDHKQIDAFRPNILPPAPVNCKRFIDELTVSPDGHTYSYQVRDVDQEVMYIDQPTLKDFNNQPRRPRNISSIEAVVRRTYSQPGSAAIAQAVSQELSAAMNAVGNLMQGLASQGVSLKGGGGTDVFSPSTLINLGQAGLTFGLTTLAVSDNVLPTFKETVNVTVHGNKYSRKQDLQYLAFSLAFGQLTNQNDALLDPGAIATQVLTGISTVLGGFIPGLVPTSAGLTLPTVADLPQSVQNAFGIIFNSSTLLNKKALARACPTAHVLSLEYDVFKRRVSVMVEQEFSGLLDYALGRQSLGRKAMWYPLKDNAYGKDWPAFFTTSLVGLLAVGALGTATSLLAARNAENPPKLEDAGNLIGTVNNYNVAISPPQDHIARSGSLLQLIAADLTNTCSVINQPLSNISGISTTELRNIPNIVGPQQAQSLSTNTSPKD